jgi:ribosomal protein L20A (L18A)
LAFPDEKVSEFSYSGNQSSQYAFSPNLVFFSIGDLYKNMFGYVESLSFSIDDQSVWSTFPIPNDKNDADNSLYPSVMDVSIGIKIIENHSIENKEFKYNFNGTRVIDKKLIQAKAAAEPTINSMGSEPEIKRTKIDVAKIKEENMTKEAEAKILSVIQPKY